MNSARPAEQQRRPDTAVEPPLSWRATFAPEAANVTQARGDLARALNASCLPAAAIGDAVLVLGELAANAVRHAGTPFAVSAVLHDGTLRLEVFDHDVTPPVPSGIDDESTSGRGLHLVSAIATLWGWHGTQEDDPERPGKVVWAELVTDHPNSALQPRPPDTYR